jgi:hypothetical protein
MTAVCAEEKQLRTFMYVLVKNNIVEMGADIPSNVPPLQAGRALRAEEKKHGKRFP